jgi:flagellar basal body-associated protein FliL
MGKKMKIMGVVAAIMLGECVVAYFLFSGSGASNPAAAEDHVADDFGDEGGSDGHGHGAKSEGHGSSPPRPRGKDASIEVLIGDFNATKYQPQANTTLRINFQLYGTVAADKEAEFKTLLEERKHRLREQVLEIVRSSDMGDLADPVLGLIKRKILEKSNRLIGKPLLKGVVFSDFSYFEQ